MLDCQARDTRLKPRPGQKFRSKFLFHAHPYSASRTTNQWIQEPVPSQELDYRVRKRGVNEWVQLGRKEKHECNRMTQEQKRPEKAKTWKRVNERALDTKWLVAYKWVIPCQINQFLNIFPP